MKALVYLGPAMKALEERAKPEIKDPTMLLNILVSHKLNPKVLITHRFKLDSIIDAYETFAHAALHPGS
jgi:hypothetical protein